MYEKQRKAKPWPVAAERECARLNSEVERLRIKLGALVGAAQAAKEFIVDVAGTHALDNLKGFPTRLDEVYNVLVGGIAMAKVGAV